MTEVPRANRMDLWTPAERAIYDAVQVVESAGADLRLTDAVRFLGLAQRSVAAFVDGGERAAGQQQDQLLAEAGIDTDRHANGAGTRHGFMWLERKGRVVGRRRVAGQNWGRDYAMAKLDGLRSCLNDNAPAGGPSDAPQERKSEARANLDRGRAFIHEATGSTTLADLLDAVCGRGDTIRALANGDKIAAAVKEAELMIALDMAAQAYDIRGDKHHIVGWREA